METVGTQHDYTFVRKGIILFDIQDFLYQGMKDTEPDIDKINERQAQTIHALHDAIREERARSRASQVPVPVVEVFLPTGDGYYCLCAPELHVVLDIARCVKGILDSLGCKAYCVAHAGDLHLFTDITGSQNATGFALGYAARLQAVSRDTEKLICSESLVNGWEENTYFRMEPDWHSAIAKDGIEYRWQLAEALPGNFCGTSPKS